MSLEPPLTLPNKRDAPKIPERCDTPKPMKVSLMFYLKLAVIRFKRIVTGEFEMLTLKH